MDQNYGWATVPVQLHNSAKAPTRHNVSIISEVSEWEGSSSLIDSPFASSPFLAEKLCSDPEKHLGSIASYAIIIGVCICNAQTILFVEC